MDPNLPEWSRLSEAIVEITIQMQRMQLQWPFRMHNRVTCTSECHGFCRWTDKRLAFQRGQSPHPQFPSKYTGYDLAFVKTDQKDNRSFQNVWPKADKIVHREFENILLN